MHTYRTDVTDTKPSRHCTGSACGGDHVRLLHRCWCLSAAPPSRALPRTPRCRCRSRHTPAPCITHKAGVPAVAMAATRCEGWGGGGVMGHAGPQLALPLQRRDTEALCSPGRSTSQNCDAPSRLHRGRNGPVSSQSKGIQTCRPSPVDRIKIHKNFASRQGMVFALPRHPPERQNDCACGPARRAEAVEGPGGAGPQPRPRRRSRRM